MPASCWYAQLPAGAPAELSHYGNYIYFDSPYAFTTPERQLSACDSSVDWGSRHASVTLQTASDRRPQSTNTSSQLQQMYNAHEITSQRPLHSELRYLRLSGRLSAASPDSWRGAAWHVKGVKLTTTNRPSLITCLRVPLSCDSVFGLYQYFVTPSRSFLLSLQTCHNAFQLPTLRRTRRQTTCTLLLMKMYTTLPTSRRSTQVERRVRVPRCVRLTTLTTFSPPARCRQGCLQAVLEVPQRQHPEEVPEAATGGLSRLESRAPSRARDHCKGGQEGDEGPCQARGQLWSYCASANCGGSRRV
jgi:hypothetical protein